MKEIHSWKKSSASGPQTDCLELTNTGMIRDSKNPEGPTLKTNLQALLRSVRTDQIRH